MHRVRRNETIQRHPPRFSLPAMNLTAIDWAIVAAYFAALGRHRPDVHEARRREPRASTSSRAAGAAGGWPARRWSRRRSPPTRRSSSPGSSSANGVAGNWLWWNMLMSGMLTVFFFARLWRRANVMTDVEFAEIRYSGKPAAFLRGFRALYLAIPINLIILGWVTRAMIKILTISLGCDVSRRMTFRRSVAVGICFVITMSSTRSPPGMWAVLWTDLVQFVIKMTAVIVLAVYAVRAVGGMDALKRRSSRSTSAARRRRCRCCRCRSTPDGTRRLRVDAAAGARRLPVGAVVGGVVSGRRAGRRRLRRAAHLLREDGARRRARHAVLPGRALRASAVAVDHHRPRDGDPLSDDLRTTRKPATCTRSSICSRRRGAAFMMAGFAAAYMSTVGTQLNWGASYLVNDFYKRFLEAERDRKHYVNDRRAARRSSCSSLRSVVTSQLSSVEQAWKFLLATRRGHGSGADPALVLVAHQRVVRDQRDDRVVRRLGDLRSVIVPGRASPPGDPERDASIMLVTVAVSTVVWLDGDVHDAARSRTRCSSRSTVACVRADRAGRACRSGWASAARGIPGGALAWTNWIAGIVAVYSTLFGIGKDHLRRDWCRARSCSRSRSPHSLWIARSFREEGPGGAAEVGSTMGPRKPVVAAAEAGAALITSCRGPSSPLTFDSHTEALNVSFDNNQRSTSP